jgi:hypothetical protein
LGIIKPVIKSKIKKNHERRNKEKPSYMVDYENIFKYKVKHDSKGKQPKG